VSVIDRDDEARFTQLETVRQYASEKLAYSGEGLDLRRSHAAYFLEFVERVEPLVNGKDRGLWLGRLDAEHDNLRAALAWSREEAETEARLRLASALLWFWFHCGYWSEGRRWLDEALAADESATRKVRTAVRAKALSAAGHLAWMQGDNSAARTQLEESVALWREVGDKQGLAHALRFLSGGVESQGDYDLVRSLAEESVALYREGTDTFGLGMALARLGSAALVQGTTPQRGPSSKKACPSAGRPRTIGYSPWC
jgi:non-specific serine/threonine protein kinase